jgi:hypothetical protein
VLNLKNKITAINPLAVPVLIYCFVIVNLLRKEIEKIDQKRKKPIAIEGIHHPKADVNRLQKKKWWTWIGRTGVSL